MDVAFIFIKFQIINELYFRRKEGERGVKIEHIHT